MEQEEYVIKLSDGTKIVTSDEELKRIMLFIRDEIEHFSQVTELLTEYKYLFSNVDPIWNKVKTFCRTEPIKTDTPTTIILPIYPPNVSHI